jgi:RNA polymerase sigma-B factor
MSSNTSKQAADQALRLLQIFQDNPSAGVKDRLVQLHADLLQKLVHDVTGEEGENNPDFLKAGVNGLEIAIQEFDLNSHQSFSDFATPYIQTQIQAGLDGAASPSENAAKTRYQSFRLAVEDTERLQNIVIGLERVSQKSLLSEEGETLSLKSETFDLLQEYRKRPSVRLRNRLVQLNTGLARKEAYHWTNQCTETFDDLLQVGLIGLIRAIERFDTSRGHAFSTFAVPYIRGEIQHYLRDKSPTVRTPRRWLVVYNNACKVVRQLRAERGREPSDREVAEHLDIPLSEWQDIKLACQNRAPISLDAPVGGEENESGSSLGDLVPDAKYRSFQIAEEDSTRLYQALSHLEDRTRQVVEYVFIKEFTHREVAEILGISAVTVSRQVKKGITVLKEIMATPLD